MYEGIEAFDRLLTEDVCVHILKHKDRIVMYKI